MSGGVEMKMPKDLWDDQVVNYQTTWYAEYHWSDPDEQ